MPTGRPSSAAASAAGSSPLQITVSIPAAVAISAATTFERIPPEPSGEVVRVISRASRAPKSLTSPTGSAAASRRGSAV